MKRRIFQIGGVLVFAVWNTLGLASTDPWAESYRLEVLTQYDAAAKSMQEIISKEPRNDFAISRRAWLNYLRGAHNDAIRDYEKALELNPDSLEARLGLMLPLISQQRWREVASNANKVLKVAPWNYYAHVRLMIAEEGEKKWDTLAKHAEIVSKRYPSDATIYVYMARAYAWMKKDSQARSAYEKVLRRVPGHIEASQYLAR